MKIYSEKLGRQLLYPYHLPFFVTACTANCLHDVMALAGNKLAIAAEDVSRAICQCVSMANVFIYYYRGEWESF